MISVCVCVEKENFLTNPSRVRLTADCVLNCCRTRNATQSRIFDCAAMGDTQ